MAKNEENRQLTENEIMTLQPNNVTFGQYDINPIQENILTCIADALQKHMQRKIDFQRDIFNQPFVTINCDDAGGENNKAKVIAAAMDLTKKTFEFRWQHPTTKREIETYGTIISTIHDNKGTNRVDLNFNIWAVPFLIYYGTGVGGTLFNKVTALTLRGKYTKRIYKIICSQRDRTIYEYPIEQFRKDMKIGKSYDNTKIRTQILEVAKKEINASSSDVHFDYEFKCRNPKKGRKPKADTLMLYIKPVKKREITGNNVVEYNFVYERIKKALDFPTDNRPATAMENILNAAKLHDVYERIGFYEDQIDLGNMTPAHVKNCILKILREDYEIK